jgi:hypothetical protein
VLYGICTPLLRPTPTVGTDNEHKAYTVQRRIRSVSPAGQPIVILGNCYFPSWNLCCMTAESWNTKLFTLTIKTRRDMLSLFEHLQSLVIKMTLTYTSRILVSSPSTLHWYVSTNLYYYLPFTLRLGTYWLHVTEYTACTLYLYCHKFVSKINDYRYKWGCDIALFIQFAVLNTRKTRRLLDSLLWRLFLVEWPTMYDCWSYQ